ncbi:MAG: spermidine synthase [Gammaproteobacteria bacterium]|jgi:spermidine synthase
MINFNLKSVMTSRQFQYLLILIFALSGATGLIYESVWSHYLKLFLGHAAYAQSLVLVIFMGGMALGAYFVSRFVLSIKNLLVSYAIIEGIIGVFGIMFHPIFQYTYTGSFDYILPLLGSPSFVHFYKFFVASILILPQSILLGATFPLMTGGFIRQFPDNPGKSISLLYFSNSIGAAIAVLISSFYLISTFGLPGSLFVAGIINILIAVIVYGLARNIKQSANEKIVIKADKNWKLLILCAAFFTGMASFIYEIAWIRMLSMVLGASTHSFELMLSAFITGLAIGGFWIRSRIDHLKNPVKFLARIQIIMGVFALSTITLYNFSFEIMAFFMDALDETKSGYVLFSLASHSIALLIMLPTTICAGMTLPLFTFILLRKGQGEQCIGQIYSANTIGAITGVLFAVFLGMPLLSLKGTIITGAVIDIIIGLVIFKTITSISRRPYFAYVSLSLFIVFIGYSTNFNAKRMASGVFRYGIPELDSKSEILFHKDGKTASVSISNWDNKQLSITTNGKPDAEITIANGLPPSQDESTMTLLAALPLSIFPAAETIANIGLGSGLTAHVALTLPNLKQVDTIEIEESIVSGARYFGEKTKNVFIDPRSNIYIDDAKTYFSTNQKKYDIVISEPSNPWVSGVSSLFTREFYNVVKSYINDDGLLVQWVHIYEFDIDLLISVLKAISEEFPYYSIYFADEGNLILIASQKKQVVLPSASIFSTPGMKQQLSTIHIHNIDDLRFRFLGNESVVNPFIQKSNIPANSDYYPFLDQKAAQIRYIKDNISDILNLRLSAVPILDLLYDDLGNRIENLSPTEYYPSQSAKNAYKIFEYFSESIFDKDNIIAIASINFLLSANQNCSQNYNQNVWVDSIFHIISKTVSYLTRDQVSQLINSFTPKCEQNLTSDNHLIWIDLYKSINERDHNGIITSASNILKMGNFSNIEQKKFLLASLLTGLIKIEKYQQASVLWNREMVNIFETNGETPLEYQFLLGLIESRLDKIKN